MNGALGDALHADLCGADYHIKLLLKKLGFLFTFIVWVISGGSPMSHRAHQLVVGGIEVVQAGLFIAIVWVISGGRSMSHGTHQLVVG